MNIKTGDKCLITTDNFFVAPDGVQYRSVFGTVRNILDPENVLGIKTNRNSTNWYIEIGNMILAGCQVHYVVKTEKINFDRVKDCSWSGADYNEFERQSLIYDADQVN